MAKKKEENKTEKKVGTFKLDEKLIQIGNLFSQLGSIDRNPGESFVLIKDNQIKTTGNGILAQYNFDSIGLSETFMPIDAKMFFSRDTGDYTMKNNKNYNIDIICNKRKSTIPLATFDEWNSIDERKSNVSFSIPSNEALDKFISYKSENIICKFMIGKNEIDSIKKYQSYFGHKANQEYFEIFSINDSITIKVKDEQKNAKVEEIDIIEGIEVNNIPANTAIKVIFSPKYLIGDDNWDVTVFTNKETSGKKIIFKGNLTNITFFTSVEDNDEEILDDEMNQKLSEIDDDFNDAEDEITEDDFVDED